MGWVRAALPVVRLFARDTATQLDFFARGATTDMVAPTLGTRPLAEHFAGLAAEAAA